MEKILTERAKEGIRAYITRIVSFARYKAGGTYTKVPIHRREVLEDGRLALYLSITPQVSGAVTITEVQLFDTDSELWASKVLAKGITISALQEGVLYRFTFGFVEEVATLEEVSTNG